MALSAPVRALPRPSWIHAGLLFGAAVAAVLLTSGHAQAATPSPAATALAAPAPVLPVVPVATPVAPPGTPVLVPVVAAAKPATTALARVIASGRKTAGAVAHSAKLPSVAWLATVVRPVVTETAAIVDRFVAPLPASDLAVAVTVLQTPSVSSVTGFAQTRVSAGSGPAGPTTSAGERTAASSSALVIAVAVNRPVATWPEPIAPSPPAPAPALPAAPDSPADAAGSGAAAQALVAVAVDAAATAPPQASRPVRRVRTDGSSAFVVSVVEWPG